MSSLIHVLRAYFQLNYLKLSYLHTTFATILNGWTFQELSLKILPSKCSMLPMTQMRFKAADLISVAKFHRIKFHGAVCPSFENSYSFRLETEIFRAGIFITAMKVLFSVHRNESRRK